VSYADLLAVESFDDYRCKHGQPQLSADEDDRFSRSGGDLLDGVFRLRQGEKSAEAVGFLHRRDEQVRFKSGTTFLQLLMTRSGMQMTVC